MNGLEAARSLIGSGRPPEGIGTSLDFTLWQVEDGFAVCGGTVGAHALNPMGFVHGGYIATLLDTACGFAFLSKLEEGQSHTTINLNVSFHRARRQVRRGAGGGSGLDVRQAHRLRRGPAAGPRRPPLRDGHRLPDGA